MKKSSRGERGTKAHSLGYMAEKLKRNLPNYEQRYILTCTAFIKVSGTFAPTTRDERKQHVEELVLLASGIESIIHRLERMTQSGMAPEVASELVVAQDVTESKTLLKKKSANAESGFYYHLRKRLLPAAQSAVSIEFKNQARDVGREVRNAVRPVVPYLDEKKLYLASGDAIDFAQDVIRTLEKEYQRVRHVLVVER